MMKKKSLFFLLFIALLGLCTFAVSCKSNKEGCGLEEKYAPKTGKDGKLSGKRSDAKLFGPTMKKRMKKQRGG
jgi:hypothetical protein